jgi:alkanesulfonate monooxygenase SsuD/methylene tetrahydromethanopterin reductase-like flavin-dependent oxidoreductase (luciferase family)
MVEYLATEVRWQDRRFGVPIDRIVLSEQLGYDAVFTAEGHGSDALTPLGYIAARTSRLKLGTRILQVTGRPPIAAARALMTLDHMAGGGRVIAGLGSGSPITAEAMFGTAWGDPVARMRDYVAILRAAFSGEPVDHHGAALEAPYRGVGTIDAPPMAIALEPIAEIPIVIAASGPAITRLSAEVGDGWMPSSFAPGMMPALWPLLDAGFSRTDDPARRRARFQVWGHVDMLVDDDVRTAMRPFKEYTAQWAMMQRPFMEARGYTDLAETLSELMAAGRVEDAIAAVPDDYIDDGWLVGPPDRIRRRVVPWLESDLTGLVVRYGAQVGPDRSGAPENLDAFRAVAEAAGRA